MTFHLRDYPCHGCAPPKRQPGCHGTCEEYIDRHRLDRERIEQNRQDTVIKQVMYSNSEC